MKTISNQETRQDVSKAYLDLLRFLLLLLSLGLGDGGQSVLLTDSSGLVAAGSNVTEGGADDTALVLDGLAGTLLGDFL